MNFVEHYSVLKKSASECSVVQGNAKRLKSKAKTLQKPNYKPPEQEPERGRRGFFNTLTISDGGLR